MIVHLVRHGETAHNRDGLGLGRDDAPLTALGEQQAEALGERLDKEPLTGIVSSPLARARRTAGSIAGRHSLPVLVRDELIELDVGKTEGLSYAAMREQFPEFMTAWRTTEAHLVEMPGGESLADVAARLRPLLVELREQDGGTVALVSHNFVIKAALCLLLGLDLGAWRGFTIDLASITTVAVNGERAIVRVLNDACHLEGPRTGGVRT